MVLNDVLDLASTGWNDRNAPFHRAASGRPSPATVGWGLVLGRPILPWSISIATGGIVAVVVAVAVVALRPDPPSATAWSVVVMAGCRVGLYVISGAMVMSEVYGASAETPILVHWSICRRSPS